MTKLELQTEIIALLYEIESLSKQRQAALSGFDAK